MFIGHDHTPTGIIDGTQIACHRLSFDVDLGLPDSQLKHKIYTSRLAGTKIYPHGGKTLQEILNQCKAKNVIPIINLNFGRKIWDVDKNIGYWKSKYTYMQWRRLARLTAEIITGNYNFNRQFISVMNEPCKWLVATEYGEYVKNTAIGLGTMRIDLPIIAGNEEYNLAQKQGDMYNYIGKHCLNYFDFYGVHPFSSGLDKIRIFKTMATGYGKPVMVTETGSWFKPYTSLEGHNINKQAILECKKYDYYACLICLVDCNSSYPNLGYRHFTDDYKTCVSNPLIPNTNTTYFNDFINFIKREGHQVEYNVPEELKEIAEQLGNNVGVYSENLPILTGTGIWQNHDNRHGADPNEPVSKRDLDCLVEKILKITGFDISLYYKPDGSWNGSWQDIAKSNPKEGA